MTRVLSIVVTLLALGGVFATAAAHAAPVAAVVVIEAAVADACAESRSEIVRIAGKFCAKRHAAGLPCAPVPVVLPPLVGAFGQVQPPIEIDSTVEGGRLDATWSRLYRPPRTGLA